MSLRCIKKEPERVTASFLLGTRVWDKAGGEGGSWHRCGGGRVSPGPGRRGGAHGGRWTARGTVLLLSLTLVPSLCRSTPNVDTLIPGPTRAALPGDGVQRETGSYTRWVFFPSRGAVPGQAVTGCDSAYAFPRQGALPSGVTCDILPLDYEAIWREVLAASARSQNNESVQLCVALHTGA